MTVRLMSYRTEEGRKTVLVDDNGKKWMHVLMMTGGLVVKRVPQTETKYMAPSLGTQKALSTVVRQFRAYGKRTGMTKAAKSFLTKAKAA